jgi:hypothetical protein
MLKNILLFLFLTTINASSFPKGGSGEYFIIGKAFDKNNQTITNDSLNVEFKGEIQIIQTDSLGRYELSIPWSTACPSHFLFTDHENEKLNPKWINVTFKGDKIKIKNEWEDYAVKPTTRKLDLKFGDESNNLIDDDDNFVIYIGLVIGLAVLIYFILKRNRK